MPDPASRPSWTAPYRLAVAFRLLRARRVNLISMVGVMLGVAAIIVVMAVMDGFQRELRAMIRGTLSDLIVELDPQRLGDYAELRRAVEGVEGVEAAALQRQAFGLVSTPTRDSDGGRQNFIPLRVVGIDPAEEGRVSSILAYVDTPEGQSREDPFRIETDEFIPEELPRVLISEWLAKRVGLSRFPLGMGDRFTLITIEQFEENGEVAFRTHDVDAIVARVYSSGNSEYDKLHLYADARGSGQSLFAAPEGIIAELRVKLRDFADAKNMVERLGRALAPFDPEFAGYPRAHIETWEERQHNLLLAVNNEKFLLAFVLFFIVLVACFTIFATLTMTVVEKTRDIGVLRALGATPGGILSIFMLNGALVGTIGAGLGYGLGLVVAANVNPIREFLRGNFGWDIFPSDIYLFDRIPAYIDHRAALAFAVGAAASALLFAIIPAVRAARLRPVNALRYE